MRVYKSESEALGMVQILDRCTMVFGMKIKVKGGWIVKAVEVKK